MGQGNKRVKGLVIASGSGFLTLTQTGGRYLVYTVYQDGADRCFVQQPPLQRSVCAHLASGKGGNVRVTRVLMKLPLSSNSKFLFFRSSYCIAYYEENGVTTAYF